MKKRRRKNLTTMISLLLVLVLLLSFYIWYLNKDKFSKNDRSDDSASGTDTSQVIATMDPELIEKIHYKNESTDMTFVREGDSWLLEADKERPIKQNYIQNMIDLVDEIKTDRIVNEKSDDLGQYGLSSPYAYIEASQSDGKSIALNIGNEVTGGQGYYAKLEDNDAVFIVIAIYGTHLSYSDANMTQVEHGPNIESNNIYHIEILQRDKEDFELIYDPDSHYHIAGTPLLSWAILKPYEEVYSADTTKVSELLSNYSTFSFLNCVEYKAEDFSSYGLLEPTASVFVEYYEQYEEQLDEPETNPDTGEEVSSKTITEEKEFKLYIGDKDDNGDYYVRKDGDSAVYTMKNSNVEKMLTIDAFSILSNFVNIYDINNINKIDINTKGKPYTMEIKRETIINDEGEEEIKSTYYYQGEIADEDIFKDVYQAMISAKIDSQLKNEVSVSDSEPILTLSYYIEGSDDPITTVYHTYDESFYLIDKGYPIRFLADKRRIDKIINAIEEFKLID
ncbi:MAG: DUF4340 domain-containing protein [Clostridiales bacterium]|nr:DUF4340 domain-containing protein [Clostridiales bacterium]